MKRLAYGCTKESWGMRVLRAPGLCFDFMIVEHGAEEKCLRQNLKWWCFILEDRLEIKCGYDGFSQFALPSHREVRLCC